MENNDAFSGYNPVANFMFFIGAVVFGMFFTHPAFLLCSILLSCSCYITVKGTSGWKFIAGMIPVFVIISLFSPLFNPNGEIVLFTYFGGRHYTLESLYYGIVLAAMFVSVMIWFASYNIVMTTDKFLYIFGRTAPSVSLVLSMIMRLIPAFQKKILQIASARMCIGKAGDLGSKREKAENSMTVISALTSWALEGGIITADSMRSRGYGAGKRSSFAIYRFTRRDILLVLVMGLSMAAIIFCGTMGGMKYISGEAAALSSVYTRAGLLIYVVFLATPTVINIMEAITWRILKSRI